METILFRHNSVNLLAYRGFFGRFWSFSVIALLLGTVVSAQAQETPGIMTCTVESATPLLRSEGFTELVGDIVITCTGGTPNAVGQTIPTSDFRIGLNTNITSRINPTDAVQQSNPDAYGPPSEALLILDNASPGAADPPLPTYPASIPAPGAPPFTLCPSLTGCPATGVGSALVSPYTPSNGAYSAYEGVSVANPGGPGYNAIDFMGVPVDAPGASLSRVIRITNLRADAAGRAAEAGAVGSIPVVAYVSISGGLSAVPITNSQPTVGYVVSGITVTPTSQGYAQCNSPGSRPGITVAEGFAYAFKPRVFSDYSNAQGDIDSAIVDDTTGYTALPQNVPGYSYFTESGYMPTTAIASGNIGYADGGTRLIFRFSNLQNGVTLRLPGTINGTGDLVLYAVTGANAYGDGGAVSDGSSSVAIAGTYAGGTNAATAFAVYEVVKATGMANESFTVSPTVSFTPDSAANVPYVTPNGVSDLLTLTSGYSQVSVSLAPSAPSSVTNPTTGDAWNIPWGPYAGSEAYMWIPRFVDDSTPSNFIGIQRCQANVATVVIQAISAPAAAPEGSLVPVGVTITNQGGAAAHSLGVSISVYYDAAQNQQVPNAQP